MVFAQAPQSKGACAKTPPAPGAPEKLYLFRKLEFLHCPIWGGVSTREFACSDLILI